MQADVTSFHNTNEAYSEQWRKLRFCSYVTRLFKMKRSGEGC